MTPEHNETSSLKRYALWGAVALGLIVIVAIVVYLVTSARSATAPAQQTPSLPVSGAKQPSGGVTSSVTYTVPISGGNSLATKNFLNDPKTVSDPNNPGYYYLGYHQSTGPQDTSATDAPPYVIEYIATTHYFNIGLYQEPIGATRKEAEQYFLNTLGISQGEACALKYMVSVPDRVNSYYSGENLGFSFCPGAVKLPE